MAEHKRQGERYDALLGYDHYAERVHLMSCHLAPLAIAGELARSFGVRTPPGQPDALPPDKIATMAADLVDAVDAEVIKRRGKRP